mmetsp:Transcript_45507/g.138000  ORF Transcript_45507/g.138000 Transcript_45507/m.138000 type:complete len:263 (-) Transcript_45507:345-1133(-)
MHLDERFGEMGLLLRQQWRQDSHAVQVPDVLGDLRGRDLHQVLLEDIPRPDPHDGRRVRLHGRGTRHEVQQRELAEAPAGAHGADRLGLDRVLALVVLALLGLEDGELALLDHVEVIGLEVALRDDLFPSRHRFLPHFVGERLDDAVLQLDDAGEIRVAPDRFLDEVVVLGRLGVRGLALHALFAFGDAHGPAVREQQLLVEAEVPEVGLGDLEGRQGALGLDRGGPGLVADERLLPEVVARLEGRHVLLVTVLRYQHLRLA